MLKPTVKASITINRIERLPELFRRAHTIATGRRPGQSTSMCRRMYVMARSIFPTVISTPTHFRLRLVLVGRVQIPCSLRRAQRSSSEPRIRYYLPEAEIHLSRAYAELAAFVDLTGMPVTYTISGKGSLPP